MKYAAIRKLDIANGPGIRVTLFVSGCTHSCKGCFNIEYQDFNYGSEWSQEVEDEILEALRDPNIKGLTVLGGEPLQQTRDKDLAKFLGRVKRETTKDVWLFTGYTYEKVIKDDVKCEILKNCDVLVDGPFIESKKDWKLRFRGSSNQRIINLKESFSQNSVVLLEDY